MPHSPISLSSALTESAAYRDYFPAVVPCSGQIAELVETLCLWRGEIQRLPFHLARIHQACAALGWEKIEEEVHQKLGEILAQLPTIAPDRRMKVRMVFGLSHGVSCEISPYFPRTVRTLRLVVDNSLNYTFKSTDRTAINRAFALRKDCDDVLIVRDHRLTDTSIANIALWHTEQQRWFTPSRPLLHGTHRAALLAAGTILEDDSLTLNRLSEFSRIRLFNAMLQWREIELPIAAIHR